MHSISVCFVSWLILGDFPRSQQFKMWYLHAGHVAWSYQFFCFSFSAMTIVCLLSSNIFKRGLSSKVC